MKKLLMVIFTENSSLGASMLAHMACENGWDADILFAPPNNYSNNTQSLLNYVLDYAPDLIAFSFKSFERKQALTLAKDLKSEVRCKIVAGGIHPTLMPEEIRNTGLFHGVISGDGMGVWENILDNYQSLESEIIQGSRNPDKYCYTKYFHSKGQIERMKATGTATVVTAMGCPYSCSFCHSGKAQHFDFPIDGIVDYMLHLHDDFGVSNFHFLDDLFASKTRRLKQFRELIDSSTTKIAFSSQVSARANTFTNEIASELKNLGVETVNFGIETASPDLLQFLNKKQTVDDCYRALEICKRFGLNSVINLMLGIPTENESDYERTLNFVRKSQPDSVNCFYYTPYPGTDLYRYCFENGYMSETFNSNTFDWFDPKIDGISDIQIKLNKIDYELAAQYFLKIQAAINRDTELMEKVQVIDQFPWILIGTTRHYYFKRLLRKLSRQTLKNCIGYIDMDPESGFSLGSDKDYTITRYDIKSGKQPSWCATHSFLGSDYQIVKKYVEENFGVKTPLISISSFKASHSITDINSLKNQLSFE